MIKKLLIFAGILALWFIVSALGVWNAYILPPPQKVFSTLLKMTFNGELFRHLLISFRRVFIGFGFSCAISFVLIFIEAIFPKTVPYYSSLINVMRHIPPISLIPLFILWFGIHETPKIIVIVLASFFPVFLNAQSGIFGCDKKLIEVGKMIGFSKTKILLSIMIPNAVPEILVGIKLALGYAWRAIVASEMIAATSGIGYLILDAQTLSRTDKVIAGVIVIGLCGILTDKLGELVVNFASRHRYATNVTHDSNVIPKGNPRFFAKKNLSGEVKNAE